jgi:type VI secretion system protein VasD
MSHARVAPPARLFAACLLVLPSLLIGCGKAKPPALPPQLPPITIAAPPAPTVTPVMMSVEVSEDVNPDPSGAPSPVVVHVYQLRAEAPFRNADFFALIDDAQKALAASLVTQPEDLYLKPGERQTRDVTFASDAAYIGVAAEFREFRTAEWRAVVPAARQGLKVSVQRARVAIAPL